MPELVLHSKDFSEGYRITSTSDGLLIETTDHHPYPLKLSHEALAEFSLRFEQGHCIPLGAEKEAGGILDGILVSLNRAIEQMGNPPHAKQRTWDVTNLRRVMTLLGGLDEEVVERILIEEGT